MVLNMKNTLRTLTLLPLLFGGSAFAQMRPISPAIINPVAGLPTLPMVLPNPVSPLAGTIMRLPSAMPSLMPDLILALAAAPSAPKAFAPAAAAPAMMIVMASASANLPAIRMDADRENVGRRLRRAQPWEHRLQLDGTTLKAAAKKDKSALDELFDRGEERGSGSLVDPLSPVGSSRRIGLPESDLEREIGYVGDR